MVLAGGVQTCRVVGENMCCTSCRRDLAASGLVGGFADTRLLFGWVEIFAPSKAILLLVDMADIGQQIVRRS